MCNQCDTKRNNQYGFKIGDIVTRDMIGEGIVKDIVIKEVSGIDRHGNSVTNTVMLILEFDDGLIIEAPAANAEYIGIHRLNKELNGA